MNIRLFFKFLVPDAKFSSHKVYNSGTKSVPNVLNFLYFKSVMRETFGSLLVLRKENINTLKGYLMEPLRVFFCRLIIKCHIY